MPAQAHTPARRMALGMPAHTCTYLASADEGAAATGKPCGRATRAMAGPHMLSSAARGPVVAHVLDSSWTACSSVLRM